MVPDDSSSIRTRPSLLNRLKQGDDTEGWQEFYRIYGKVVRDFAIHAGLTDSEADEVVQETAIAISRHLPQYRYDRKVCRFKTFLLNQASWRVKDQFKKRKKTTGNLAAGADRQPACSADETTRTSMINRVPDPAVNLEQLFEIEYHKHLFDSALDEVKKKFSLKQFQMFDLFAMKEWPAADVARALGVTSTYVHVTRHRFVAAIKKETKRLEQRFERAAERQAAAGSQSEDGKQLLAEPPARLDRKSVG
jgi:RNA polymerase sigma-70 factor (ECF subfamily)